MNTMVPFTFNMGTQEAYDFYLDLNRELKEKIERKEGVARRREVSAHLGGGTPFLVCAGLIFSTSTAKALFSC